MTDTDPFNGPIIEEPPTLHDAPLASAPPVVLPPPPSTPVADALVALRGAGGLSAADCEGLGNLVGVRTLGDLQTVLERGEIADKKLEKKLRQVLG